jgi:calcium-dependent protein kinase
MPQSLRRSALESPQSQAFKEQYELLDGKFSHQHGATINSRMHEAIRLARCLATGAIVAVKRLQKKGLSEKQQISLLRQVDILSSLDHMHVMRLLQVFHERDSVYLIMEYCSGGTLKEKLEIQGRFDEKQAARIVQELLSAVVYCHGRPSGAIVHRNLTLENFAYDFAGDDAVLKLLGFGCAGVIAPGIAGLFKPVGTLEYAAPEMIRDEKHNEACDIWSIGVIAYALLSGKLPFNLESGDDTASAILEGSFSMQDDVWNGISEGGKSFIKDLLKVDPKDRLIAEDALCHPWISCSWSEDVCATHSIDVLKSIGHFANANSMRRASANLAVLGQVNLKGEDVKIADKQFNLLDADGNGTISRSELTDVLQKELGISTEQGEWVFDQLDLDGDLEIQRTEFLAAVVGARLLASDVQLEKAFMCLSKTRPGMIRKKDLNNAFGDTFCGKPTAEIFEELDESGDGVIDFGEFHAAASEQPALLAGVYDGSLEEIWI